MKDLEDIAKAVTSMNRDLARLGDCKKLLASPTLYEAMLKLFAEGHDDPEIERSGTLWFRGTATIKCDHLQGMEYAFVK